MSDAQAGTPTPPQDGTPTGGTPATGGDGSGDNEQKWQEALKWKQKAEDFNRLEAEKKAIEARAQQLEQLVYSRGAGQATDPTAELVAQLREQAAYDPVAKATLMNMEMTARSQAEAWLAGQLISVPDAKRDRVAALVRNSGYQMGVSDALSMVTDPDTKTLSEQLEHAQREIARLSNVQKNGSSPAAAVPSSANANDDSGLKEMKRSDYLARIRAGGQAAKDLMRAVGENRTKLVDD